MSNADKIWDDCVTIAHALVTQKNLKKELQPIVDAILADPYVAAYSFMQKIHEIAELKDQIKNLRDDATNAAMGD